jgi:hypothetical protein
MSSKGARTGTAVAGILCTLIAAVFSLGAALFAVVAMSIGYVVMKRRGRRLTRGVSWFVAVGGVAVALLLVFAGFVLQAETATFTSLRQAMDSAAAKPPPPPPKWLERITPPNVQRQNELTDKLLRSKGFTLWTLVMGAVFGVGFLSTVIGSVGWVGGFLLIHAATGSWLPRATLEDYRD